MSSFIINLDTYCSKALHRPSLDGDPLYARLNEVSSDKSEKWIKASASTYSSPNNIRKVFIHSKGVLVQLYKSAIVRGEADKAGCWRSTSFPDASDLLTLVNKNLSYNQNMSKYFMEKHVNPNAKAPDKVTIRGTGLSALSTPYVCSNIEEVYFDCSILASEAFLNAHIGAGELLESYINGKRGLVQSNLPTDMFFLANNGNIKDLRTRYPRLRCIGLISELSSILNQKYDAGELLSDVSDSEKLWVKRDSNVELIKQSNSLVIMNDLHSDISMLNTTFAVRDGLYKFDAEVLKQYFDKYTAEVSKYKEIKLEQQEKSARSSFEVTLDNVYDKLGQENAKSVLMLSLSGLAVSEVNKIFSEMTVSGQKKYKSLMGA